MKVKRSRVVLKPDSSRVFFRPLEITSEDRVLRICARVMALRESEVERKAKEVLRDFADRHHRLHRFLLQQADALGEHLFTDHPLSEPHRLLLGACFTQEYSLEAAALFNPSIVPHPDQRGLDEGSLRFVLSLRATGEGHISSIVFRTGVVDREAQIHIDAPSSFVTAPEVHPDPSYDKHLFERKLHELGLISSFAREVLADLDNTFTLVQLTERLRWGERRTREAAPENREALHGILALAHANYEVSFEPDQPYSERVIFPATPAEKKGIEDARFVAFVDDEDGATTYYATYTAFDGQVILPQILETRDFVHFRISTLNGPEVQNKGMALFPRKIGGLYVMLSRQDNENLYLMESDLLHFWYSKRILLRPTYPWEFVQVGNCGSPIETEAGWLVLAHGVGPMRKYAIGAILLDRHDPSRVLGRLPRPLLSPNETEREGYVPNVVYTCGALVHAGHLILPYAMSDQCTTFATVPLDELLKQLLSHGPSPR